MHTPTLRPHLTEDSCCLHIKDMLPPQCGLKDKQRTLNYFAIKQIICECGINHVTNSFHKTRDIRCIILTPLLILSGGLQVCCMCAKLISHEFIVLFIISWFHFHWLCSVSVAYANNKSVCTGLPGSCAGPTR